MMKTKETTADSVLYFQLQIVDKTIMEADKDRDGKISFEEFTKMVENTDVSMSMTLGASIASLATSSHSSPVSTSNLTRDTDQF